MEVLYGLVLAVASVALSAIGAWLLGRRARFAPEDPVFAEKLQRHNTGVVFAVLLVTVAAAVGAHELGLRGPILAPFALCLMLLNALGAKAGGFGVRQRLMGERTTLAEALGQTLRFTLGFLGFWLLLLLAPYVVERGGVVAATVLAGVLIGWGARYAAALLRIVGARPIEQTEVVTRCEEIASRSRVDRVGLFVFGSSRSRYTNAFALPHAKTPRVLFSARLLDELSVDEVGAIFAHEIAHLEDFDRRRLRRGALAQFLLVLVACGAVPLLRHLAPWLATPFLWGWMIIVLTALVLRARAMQPEETSSDLRAVELCGDAELLVSALEKIHRLNHMPRRLAAAAERGSTHPSLARRIDAIRRAAGRLPDEAAPRRFTERRGRAFVELEGDAVVWDGTRIEYGSLVELRVAAMGRGSQLRAVGRDGKRRRMLLVEADVAGVQEALDAVDGRLAPVRGGRDDSRQRAGAAIACGLVGVTAFFTLGLLTTGSVLIVMLATIPAMVRPRGAWVRALGAMALYAAVAAFVHGRADGSLLVAAMGLAGVLALARAPALREGGVRFAALFFGGGALLIAAFQMGTILDRDLWLRLHLWSVDSTGSLLPWVAAAAALALRARRAAFALALVPLAALAFGSPAFRRAAGDDPLAARGPDPAFEAAPFEVRAARTFAGRFDGLAVAPDGSAFLSGGRLCGFSGEDRPLPADVARATFADAARLAVVVAGEIQYRDATEPGTILWRRRLPGLDEERGLDLAAAGDRWRIVTGRHAARTVRYRGVAGEDRFDRRVWERDASAGRYVDAGDELLELGRSLPPPPLGAWATLRCAAQSAVRRTTTVAWFGGARSRALGVTAAWVDARDAPPGERGIVGIAGDRSGSTVWMLGPDGFETRFATEAPIDWDRRGERIALLLPDAVHVVDLATRAGRRIQLPPDGWIAIRCCTAGAVVVRAAPHEFTVVRIE